MITSVPVESQIMTAIAGGVFTPVLWDEKGATSCRFRVGLLGEPFVSPVGAHKFIFHDPTENQRQVNWYSIGKHGLCVAVESGFATWIETIDKRGNIL